MDFTKIEKKAKEQKEQSSVEQLHTLIEQQQHRIEQLTQEVSEYREANGTLSSEKSTLQSKLDELLPKMSELRSINRELQTKQDALLRENSELRSSNQEMTSKLTTAQSEIDELTKRAASVNSTSVENEKLKRENENAQRMSTKAEQKMQWADRKADRAEQDRWEERKRREKAEDELRVAVDRAHRAEGTISGTKSRYASLFFGIALFTVAIAVMELVQHSAVLRECGVWFSDRWDGLTALFSSLKGLYLSAAVWFTSTFPEGCPGYVGHIFAVLSALIILALITLVLLTIWQEWLSYKIDYIGIAYYDGEFKAIFTAAAAITLFYVCLFFYEPIKAVLPRWNIFPVWLIGAFLAAFGINAREIITGLKK